MVERSLREAISRTRGEFKIISSDTVQNASDRFIASELESTALKFVRQVTDKRKLWNSGNLFTVLPCLKMQQVSIAECCGYRSDYIISRSVVQLPKIAEGNNFGMLIQGVYSIDLISRRFIESTPDRFVNSLSLGLKTNQIHFWIQNKFLYIGSDSIEKVKISAYFEEDIPESLQWYPGYCNSPLSVGCCSASSETNSINDMNLCCPPNPYDLEFKCPGYMQDDVIKEVANKLSGTYKRSADSDNGPFGKDNSK